MGKTNIRSYMSHISWKKGHDANIPEIETILFDSISVLLHAIVENVKQITLVLISILREFLFLIDLIIYYFYTNFLEEVSEEFSFIIKHFSFWRLYEMTAYLI